MANQPVPDYSATYRQVVGKLINSHGKAEAMSEAVGRQFEAFGILMRQILFDAGLRPNDYLIDVGCGSGRLAHTLSVKRYLGTDVVPELLEHARNLCPNQNWRFEIVNDIVISEEDDAADMVCFFSVFTHLLHEDTYRYLQEAKRVLKPGGKVVFSFLEMKICCHWPIFEDSVNRRMRGDQREHTQFMSRDLIDALAVHLGCTVEAFFDGDIPHIRLDHPVTLDDGRTTDFTSLGQSVCVLQKGNRPD
jgi:SAM-dependent methyltransferase